MATRKQKKAVQKMVENGGVVSRAMRDAGYSEETAKTPKKLTESKGFKELLEQYLPDDLILSALEEDIRAKKMNRKGELELASKIKGLLTNKTDITSNGEKIVLLPSEVLERIGDTPEDTAQ